MSFNTITHPTTGVRYSIFSSPGRELLKSYLRTYKSGGSFTGPLPFSELEYKNPLGTGAGYSDNCALEQQKINQYQRKPVSDSDKKKARYWTKVSNACLKKKLGYKTEDLLSIP